MQKSGNRDSDSDSGDSGEWTVVTVESGQW
jgi:hypothetical protein